MFEKLLSAHAGLEHEGARRLGSVFWWALSSNRISHADLEAVARRHGLDDRFLPSSITPTGAFRRAWRHAAREVPEGTLLRPIVESSKEIVIGLVDERPDEEHRDLEYRVRCRIWFDNVGASLGADAENHVTKRVSDLFEHHLGHTTRCIRSMMSRFLSESGVPLRSSGGVYFVAKRFEADLEALCSVVEEIGQNQPYRLPILAPQC